MVISRTVMDGSGCAGLAAAFAAGVVSFVSRCVLPLVPAHVSYVAGQPLLTRGSGSPRSR